jgi:hypothetical protein
VVLQHGVLTNAVKVKIHRGIGKSHQRLAVVQPVAHVRPTRPVPFSAESANEGDVWPAEAAWLSLEFVNERQPPRPRNRPPVR